MTQINADRLLSTLETLRNFGRDGTGVHRPALTPADLDARLWLRGQLAGIGYDASIDRFGTVFGRAPGDAPVDPHRVAHRHGAAWRVVGRGARRRPMRSRSRPRARKRWVPTRPGSTWCPFRTRKGPSCRCSARAALSGRSPTPRRLRRSRRSMAAASAMRLPPPQFVSSRSPGSMRDARLPSSKPISSKGPDWRRRACRSAS